MPFVDRGEHCRLRKTHRKGRASRIHSFCNKVPAELPLQRRPDRPCYRSGAAPRNAGLLVRFPKSHHIPRRIKSPIEGRTASLDEWTGMLQGSELRHPSHSGILSRLGVSVVWLPAFTFRCMRPCSGHVPPEAAHGGSVEYACCCGFLLEMLVDILHVPPTVPSHFITGPFFVRRIA